MLERIAPQGERRRRWLTSVASAALIVLALVFVVANRNELPTIAAALKGTNPYSLAAIVALTAVAVLNYCAMFRASYRVLGLRLSGRDAVMLGLGALFVNQVSKSSGMGGIGLFLRHGRQQGDDLGKVAAAYVLATITGHLSFAVVLVAALVAAWADGQLHRAELIAALIFAVYFCVQAAAVVAAFQSRGATRWLFRIPKKLLSTARRRPFDAASHSDATADELFEAVGLIRRGPMRVIPPAIHALAWEALAILTLWLVVYAVGGKVSLAVALVAYAISVLFSIVGILPAGAGTAEASLGAVLVAFGLPVATATAATLVYRLFDTWVPFVLGAIAARQLSTNIAVPP